MIACWIRRHHGIGVVALLNDLANDELQDRTDGTRVVALMNNLAKSDLLDPTAR